ncbi:MAG TPA: PPC domain-containing DNA-binding protein [Opitutaceae bacterium]|nr:PPC domain-containing DNA-binding protein [Opitutaceae bacterium]
MKTILLMLSFLAAASGLAAQETRTERTSPPNAADAKPNSDQVPAVYAIDGRFERIVVLRFKYQTDLLAGLESMVQQQKIRNAVILAGLGSVRSYHFHVVSNREFPSKNIFVRNPAAPADLVSMNGYVIDGRVHAHMTLSDERHAFGGHLEPGTSVFTFAIVTLGVLGDATNFDHLDDKNYR